MSRAKAETKADQPQGEIVSAVGVSVNSNTDPSLASRMEEAMRQAILKAYEEGVTDPAAVSQRMTEARQAIETER